MSIRGFVALLVLMFGWPALAAEAEQASEQNPGHFEIPAWFKTSFLDLAMDAGEAADSDKRLMIMFHQNGCPYCAKLINDNFTRPGILDYFRRHFDALEINLWGDREVTDFDGESLPEKQFAIKHKVWATPTLLFYDENGQQVLRLDGYYPPERFMIALRYVAEKREEELSFRDYHARQSAHPPGDLIEEPFFAEPPYNLPVDAGDKPIAVLFEEPNCAPCRELHENVLNRVKTRDRLDEFLVVQLARWRDTPLITPSGEKTTAREWAEQLDISYLPTLVLFAEGKKILKMDALLKAYHLQGILEYVSSGAYREQPNFQRYLHDRSERLRQQGATVDMWN